MCGHLLGQVNHLARRVGNLEVGRRVAHTEIDDALRTLTNDIRQVGSTVLIEDVVVQDVLADDLTVLGLHVVEAIQHVIQGKFQHHRVLLAGRLHDVNATQEAGRLAIGERPHHGLDPIRQGHRTDQTVVAHVDVTEECAFVSDEMRLLPRQELGHVRTRVITNEFVLGLRQLLFLGLNLGVDGGFIAPALLAQLSNLILVGRFGSAVGEPRPVLPAIGPATHQASILEFDAQIRLIRVHHDVRRLLDSLVAQPVEAPAHFDFAEIKLPVDHGRRVQDRDVPALGLEEVQHAIAGFDGAAEVDLAHLVSQVVIVDAIEEIGILPGAPRDLLPLAGGRRAFRRRSGVVLFHLGSEGSGGIHDRTLRARLGRVTG